jgi:hypothetical protein
MTFRRLLPYLLTIVALCAAFFPKPGRAAEGDTWLGINGLSYHFKREVDYNEVNNGLGIEHHITDKWRLHAGKYENSYYRESIYLGAAYMPWQFGDPNVLRAEVGGALWAVTGYEEGPVVVPFGVISLEHKRIGANIGVSPAVIMFQLRFKLN